MDFTLHIGAHRTATTTLQRYLAEQKAALAQRGVAVWGPPHTRDGRLAGLLGDPGHVSTQRAALARRSGNRVRLAHQMLADTGHTRMILSEENLLGSLRENLGLGVLYPTAARRLVRLAEAIRSHESYWPSVIAHMLRRGFSMPDAEVLAHVSYVPRSWRDVIEDVAETFPGAEILVWSYERMGGLPHVAARALTGVPLAVPTRPLHLNASPSAEALRSALVFSDCDASVIHAEGARFVPFSPSQRRGLRAAYADDIAWLTTGADGLATYIDNEAIRPDLRPSVQVSDREGCSHDGPDTARPHQAVGRTRDEGTAGQTH
jgi:hypothetical protein